jgi:hypothetical protein
MVVEGKIYFFVLLINTFTKYIVFWKVKLIWYFLFYLQSGIKLLKEKNRFFRVLHKNPQDW